MLEAINGIAGPSRCFVSGCLGLCHALRDVRHGGRQFLGGGSHCLNTASRLRRGPDRLAGLVVRTTDRGVDLSEVLVHHQLQIIQQLNPLSNVGRVFRDLA